MKSHLLTFWGGVVILLSAFSGCVGDGSEDGGIQEQDTDSVHIEYVDSLYVLNDTFTMIKRMLCEEGGDSLVDYTNENASFIPYDLLDPTAFFFYISDVDCGVPGGTCGHYISLIERKDSSEYVQKVQVCGHIDSVDFSMKKLYYSTVTDNKQYLLDFLTADPVVEYLSINHIPLYEVDYIGNALEVLSGNLVFNNDNTDNPDAIRVSFNKVDVNGDISLAVYSLKNNNIPYCFAFLRKNNQPVKDASVGGTGNITWHSSQGGVLVKYQSGQMITQYKIDLTKKSFVKM